MRPHLIDFGRRGPARARTLLVVLAVALVAFALGSLLAPHDADAYQNALMAAVEYAPRTY